MLSNLFKAVSKKMEVRRTLKIVDSLLESGDIENKKEAFYKLEHVLEISPFNPFVRHKIIGLSKELGFSVDLKTSTIHKP